VARLYRSVYKPSYTTVNCEIQDQVSVITLGNISQFYSTGTTYRNLTGLLGSSQTWLSMSPRYTYFRVKKISLTQTRGQEESYLSTVYGNPQGGLSPMHYKFFANSASTNYGNTLADLDKVKMIAPFANMTTIRLPYENSKLGFNSPYGQWATTADLAQCYGQLSMWDGNDYLSGFTSRLFYLKIYILVEFKDPKV
jgi:hypothetical protein